jgi:hypothetical protein
MVRDNRAFLTSAAARAARAGVEQYGLVYPLCIVGIKR